MSKNKYNIVINIIKILKSFPKELHKNGKICYNQKVRKLDKVKIQIN
jgi:hypothetical protein